MVGPCSRSRPSRSPMSRPAVHWMTPRGGCPRSTGPSSRAGAGSRRSSRRPVGSASTRPATARTPQSRHARHRSATFVGRRRPSNRRRARGLRCFADPRTGRGARLGHRRPLLGTGEHRRDGGDPGPRRRSRARAGRCDPGDRHRCRGRGCLPDHRGAAGIGRRDRPGPRRSGASGDRCGLGLGRRWPGRAGGACRSSRRGPSGRHSAHLHWPEHEFGRGRRRAAVGRRGRRANGRGTAGRHGPGRSRRPPPPGRCRWRIAPMTSVRITPITFEPADGPTPSAAASSASAAPSASAAAAQSIPGVSAPGTLIARTRRLRTSPAMRSLVRETRLSASGLIAPLFIVEGTGREEPIAALPGQSRLSPDRALRVAEELAHLGVGGLLLFGVPDPRTTIGDRRRRSRRPGTGVAARAPRGRPAARHDRRRLPLRVHDPRPLRSARRPDASTTTRPSRCSPRPRSRTREAGADIVAPSAMMDGQVAAIRAGLDGRRPTATPRSWPTPASTPRRSTARSARPRARRRRSATGAPTRWMRPTAARRCARWSSTPPRAPTC